MSPKTDRLPAALLHAGYTSLPSIAATASPPYSRRRMDLAVRRIASGVELGLHRHRSHDIVTLHTCNVLHPALVGLFEPLRMVLPKCDLLRREGSIIANRLDDGIDLLLRTDGRASTADRTRLAAFAVAHGLSRISHATGSAALPETLAMRHRPTTTLSGVAVHPPPGAFLQATAHGAQAIIAAVLEALPARLTRKSRIAELYAGIGTLTFALAAQAQVHAYEAEPQAYAALREAAGTPPFTGRITTVLRDLTRQPLAPAELGTYAAIVLDPPAAGALPQIRQLMETAVPRVIYVSCDPDTFARDAGLLRAGGYRLVAATTINQFIGAARVESVCTFEKGKVRGAVSNLYQSLSPILP